MTSIRQTTAVSASARTRTLHAAVRSGVRVSAETANPPHCLRRGRAAWSAGQEVADLRTVGVIYPSDRCTGTLTWTADCVP